MTRISKGKIIVEQRAFNDGKLNPGALIEGKNCSVYSCSSWLAKAVDTLNGLIVIYVEFNNYFFSYDNLESTSIVKGQAIKQGEMIGRVKNGERLFLIASKDNVLIEPERILKCKVVDEYTK